MLVLCALIYIEVVEQCATERTLGEHTLDSVANNLVDTVLASTEVGRSVEALTTGIAGIAGVNLVSFLLTSEANLSGIDNDYVVKFGLYLPRSNFATFEQRRPTIWSVASITTHSLVAVSLLTEIVL